MVRVRNVPALVILVLLQSACVGARSSDQHVVTGLYPIPASGADSTSVPRPSAAGAGRLIVPRDLLDVTVFEAPELSRVVRVSDAGTIGLPLLGPIHAAGRTPRELEIGLQDTLRRTYMRDPRVTVDVKEPAVQPVYVVGEVTQPGAFVPSGEDRLTVLRALAVARGVKPTAAQGRAVVIRLRPGAEPLQIRVNLNAIVKGKAPDPVLLPNDVVYVPKNAERAVALGLVDAMVRLITFKAVF